MGLVWSAYLGGALGQQGAGLDGVAAVCGVWVHAVRQEAAVRDGRAVGALQVKDDLCELWPAKDSVGSSPLAPRVPGCGLHVQQAVRPPHKPGHTDLRWLTCEGATARAWRAADRQLCLCLHVSAWALCGLVDLCTARYNACCYSVPAKLRSFQKSPCTVSAAISVSRAGNNVGSRPGHECSAWMATARVALAVSTVATCWRRTCTRRHADCCWS